MTSHTDDGNRGATRTTDTFTIVTFNVRNSRSFDGLDSWVFRQRALLTTIEQLGPEVLALQEVRPTQLRYLSRHLKSHLVVTAGRDDGKMRGEHCTVMIDQRRFEVVEHLFRWFSPDPTRPGSRDPETDHPRIATFVRLRDRRSNALFGIVNLHIDHSSSAARGRAIEAVSAHILDESGTPWIVTGDFNCRIDDDVMDPLWDSGMRDALSELPPSGPRAASFHGFRGTTDGDRIDHIVLSSDIAVDESWIDFGRPAGRLPSDHWPVAAKVYLTPTSRE